MTNETEVHLGRCPACAAGDFDIIMTSIEPGRPGLDAVIDPSGLCAYKNRNPLVVGLRCKLCGRRWYEQIDHTYPTEGDVEDGLFDPDWIGEGNIPELEP